VRIQKLKNIVINSKNKSLLTYEVNILTS